MPRLSPPNAVLTIVMCFAVAGLLTSLCPTDIRAQDAKIEEPPASTSPRSESRPEIREWNDATGRFTTQARIVTADDELVVLEAAGDEELMIIRQDQLSDKDQRYVAQHANIDGEDRTEATSDDTRPEAKQQKNKRNIDSAWKLRGGGVVNGQLLGFGDQTLNVERRDGDVLVNERRINDLAPAYTKIVPDVVSRVDKAPVKDLAELEKHLAAGGGGPFPYVVEGVQVRLESGDVLTIPLALLESKEIKQVRAGFQRWKAAHAGDVSGDDRAEVDRRERLMLDSYHRTGRRPAARQRPSRFLQLQLLAIEAGLTDLWEVTLYPPRAYGYPYVVVVPGRNSGIAQRRALSEFPGWRLGLARRLSTE